MSTEHPSRITELFHAARERPAAGRDTFLREACDDEATRAEILAMLAAYDEDPEFLEAPADASAVAEAIESRIGDQPGRLRLGAYRIVREIGRGGMGVVYEAARDDAEFERRVAIKVLPAAWAAPSLAERFRFERQVLAGLDHPNIARLLDAGTTEDGAPYFVMEYVDGDPIDVWCRDKALTIRQRVEVLREVCGAVAHAHQHLVVHRDLKPANILMTAEGKPKLLDFGIATLVSDESGASTGLTRTGQSSFTPEYASPEQVRGERVTTATDVYSLGVLAYRLLAERAPYVLRTPQGLPAIEAVRIICDVEPPRPSSVAPAASAGELRGDLDQVVLKALRKEPADRYPAVFGLSADLTAWLEGRLVTATPATLGYRARKFVARNRVGVGAAAVVVLALGVGGAATAWQASAARFERDRAQRRFDQARQFSRSLLFEVHESLRGIPGATEPRRLLLQRAVEFLDSLASDAGFDEQLKLELAQGYRRLGQVQGSSVSDNVGDTAAAITSFQKATRLSSEVLTNRPDSLGAFDVATGALDDLSAALWDRGTLEAADAAFGQHLALVERFERSPGGVQPGARASIAASYVNMGRFRSNRGDRTTAQAFYGRAIQLYEGLPPDARGRDSVRSSYSVVLKRAGALLLVDGKLDEAERLYRAALALDEELVARYPDNATYRYDMTFSLSDLALAARKRGDPAAATALYLRALEIRQAALDADPKNVRAMLGIANLHNYLGTCAAELKHFDEQLTHRREALRLNDAVTAIRGPQAENISRRVWWQTYLAGALMDLAEHRPAADRPALLDEAAELLKVVGPSLSDLVARRLADPALPPAFEAQRARLRRLR